MGGDRLAEFIYTHARNPRAKCVTKKHTKMWNLPEATNGIGNEVFGRIMIIIFLPLYGFSP